MFLFKENAMRGCVLTAIVVVGLTEAGVAAQQGGGGRGGGSRIPPTGAIEKVKDNLHKIGGAGGVTNLSSHQAEALGDGGGDHSRASGTYLTGVHVKKSDSIARTDRATTVCTDWISRFSTGTGHSGTSSS